MQYNYNDYKGTYETSPLKLQRGSFPLITFHEFKLGTLPRVSLHGFYRIKGQLQFYELSDFGNVHLNINRQFLNKILVASLSISDLFFTDYYRFVLNQGSVSATGARANDTHQVGLSLRYNFGIRTIDEK